MGNGNVPPGTVDRMRAEMRDPAADRALTVHEGQCMATVTCNCRLGNPPMLIPAVGLQMLCVACKSQFFIMKMSYEHDKMQFPQVMVGKIDPAKLPVADGPKLVQ